jgi:hypothetical protein
LTRELADASTDALELAIYEVAGASAVIERRRPAERRGRSLWTVPGRRNEDRRIQNFKDYLGVAFGKETIVDKPEASQIVSLDCLGFVSVTFDY